MFYLKQRLAAFVALLSMGLAPAAWASDFDGSRALVCAPTDMFECARGVPCMRATADEINIPGFIHVDFSKKTIHGTIRGKADTSRIMNLTKVAGATILQGVDGGHAWSILIDQGSGKMSMGVNAATDGGHPVGFSILGACTAR
jgi:hypothetical protein